MDHAVEELGGEYEGVRELSETQEEDEREFKFEVESLDPLSHPFNQTPTSH